MIKETKQFNVIDSDTHNLTCPHCLVHGMIQDSDTPDTWVCVAPYCGREFSQEEIHRLLQDFHTPITRRVMDECFQSAAWKQKALSGS